jgi:hypothetical protein
MKSALKTGIFIYFVFSFSAPLWSATIISPAQDEQVYAGALITVVVKPEPGEQWQGFVMGFKAFYYDPTSNVYKLSIQIPTDVLGYRDDLRVHGVDKNNKEFELSRRIFVKLPPNVVLQSVLVDDYKTLYKLPPGSTPQDMQRIGSRQLRVEGKYSDGVERDLTSSTSGTTYTSSNNKIVTVNSEGKMTAQAIGEAKITVRNGKYSAQVDIV